jgi:hypothetical protein
MASSLSISTGGTGYVANNTITLDCPNSSAYYGTGAVHPILTVTSVSSGVVTGIALTNPGFGNNIPTSNVAGVPNGTCTFTQSATSGSGTGFTVTGAFGFNAANVPSGSGIAQGIELSGAYTGTFADGLVLDYVTGTGRFIVNTADGFAWYNGATLAGTRLAGLSSTGVFDTSAFQSSGTIPTLTFSGDTCAGTVIAGGASAGTVTLTGACAATNTLALTVMPTVAHGYACNAFDRTTQLALLSQTATSVTSATFTFQGVAPGGNFVATGATDVIQYSCTGY